MRIAVLGASGAMARVVGRDLLEYAGGVQITAADRLPITAVDPRVTAAQVDVRDVAATAKLLRGHDAVLNCVTYYHNVEVMRAALLARVPYSDLGGLYHVSLRQLALDGDFRAAGVTALIGMGSAPGITNAIAGALARRFEVVEEMHVRVASIDEKGAAAPLPAPWALDTLLDEASLEPMVLSAGQPRAVPPLSGRETIEFPEPVGRVEAVYTLHSEVAMLSASFPRLRECSFKIALAPDLLTKLRFLVELGFASREVVVRGVSAREVLLELAARRPEESQPADCDVLRVEVVGRRGGRRGLERGELVVRPPGLGGMAAGAFDTGVPLAIAGVMLASREISAPGVWGPERALPFELFFAVLA
jgi:saccharopine dehydrogenase-like NADP-dependent oxidoreductase